MSSPPRTAAAHARRWHAAIGLAAICVCPVILASDLWRQAFSSALPRSIDGAGHAAVAHLYTHGIFPDTFGWLPELFAGMPFPNFYPPGFYWLVAALATTTGLDDIVALKAVVFLSMLLLPAAVWWLTWCVSGRLSAAHLAALLSLGPMLMPGYQGQWASGLDYMGTFAVGLYTQPLAFLALAGWYAIDLRIGSRFAERGRRDDDAATSSARVAAVPVGSVLLASVLLAAVLLINVFAGMTALLLAGASMLVSALRVAREHGERALTARRLAGEAAAPHDALRIAWRELAMRAGVIGFSALLVAFWYVPMIASYDYVVTRPMTEIFDAFARVTIVWYALATACSVALCLAPARRPPTELFCGLASLLLFMSVPAAWLPPWFPLQGWRLTSAVNLLCCLPIACGLAYGAESLWRSLASRLDATRWRRAAATRQTPRRLRVVAMATMLAPSLVMLALPLIAWTRTSQPGLRLLNRFWSDVGFYHDETGPHAAWPDEREAWLAWHPAWMADVVRASDQHFGNLDAARALAALLAFGRTHRDGRYLVESPNPYALAVPAFDARAIAAYLAAQGNDVLTGVLRESAAMALFANPQAGAFSASPDLFGISSALGGDRAFLEQPLSRHLARCRFLGVRFLIVITPAIVERLSAADELRLVLAEQGWRVYELRDPPAPLVETVRARPALVFGALAMKARRSGELSFTRIAEEQFSDGWFDVLLARAPRAAIDRAKGLDRFGAIILLDYACDDCDAAYHALRTFAQTRPVVAIAAENRLFDRLQVNRAELPGLVVFDRPPDQGDWLRGFYGSRPRQESSPVRALWREMRDVLSRTRQPLDTTAVHAEVTRHAVRLRLPSLSGEAMVLYRGSHHPGWRRSGAAASSAAEPVYAVAPMFILLPVTSRDVELTFARAPIERGAAAVSALTATGVLAMPPLAWWRRRRQAWRAVVEVRP